MLVFLFPTYFFKYLQSSLLHLIGYFSFVFDGKSLEFLFFKVYGWSTLSVKLSDSFFYLSFSNDCLTKHFSGHLTLFMLKSE